MTENPDLNWAVNFYNRYYQAVASSRANSEYCRRLFGADMAQHGFAEVSHIDHLVQAAGIGPSSRILDLGCGNGKMIEYISDQIGAHGVGIDFVPAAIEQALACTRGKRDRLDFREMDLTRLVFPPASFDAVLSVDTLYFTDDLQSTLAGIIHTVRPGGILAAFYTEAWDPHMEVENYPREKLFPDRTDLARAAQKLGLPYQYWDYSAADVDHAHRKKQISEHLRADFSAEGNLFLYENHMDEANGVLKAHELGLHTRFLYCIECSE